MSGTKEEAQAVESQAIGRAYRQGQTQKVTIVRFIVKETLEQEIYLRNNPNQGLSTFPRFLPGWAFLTGLSLIRFRWFSSWIPSKKETFIKNKQCYNFTCKYSFSTTNRKLFWNDG
jgi:hypothetical protein